MNPPRLLDRHVGERVRIRLSPWGSIVGTVLDVDELAIAVRLGDDSIATVPLTSIASIRTRAAWAGGSA
jgi:hypothetical protein